ncbi:MAG: methionyl-tRNA formyltransferase, partial [Clostridiales Family XIII bacterium]|nr:methionyl-tRNA formyltransferase [Clostridiales Family XIII bacterium]
MKRQGTTIVYMGTPEFAVPALSGLIRAGWDVALAVTQPDRPVGRGKKLTHSPVKRCALASGIPVAQPAVLRGNVEFIGRIADLRPDLIVVAAYGKILPRDVLEIPKLGCVNIHASLLPKYRGAAPIHRAVEAGERTTGVTLMYMTEELDAGDIIEAAGIGIAGMNTGQVYDLLAPLGARLLMDALPDIVAGTAGRTAQDCDAATYAPPVDKAEGHIDFAEPVRAIENRIRAMN